MTAHCKHVFMFTNVPKSGPRSSRPLPRSFQTAKEKTPCGQAGGGRGHQVAEDGGTGCAEETPGKVPPRARRPHQASQRFASGDGAGRELPALPRDGGRWGEATTRSGSAPQPRWSAPA